MTRRRSSLPIWLAALLVWLQLVAPFVHAHVGAWSVTGLHFDAPRLDAAGAVEHLQAHARVADAQVLAPLAFAPPESAAIGVEPGLRPVSDLVALLAAAALLCGLLRPRDRRSEPVFSPWPVAHAAFVPRLRPPNAPPPSAAPPAYS